jgi:hypothetical protein
MSWPWRSGSDTSISSALTGRSSVHPLEDRIEELSRELGVGGSPLVHDGGSSAPYGGLGTRT